MKSKKHTEREKINLLLRLLLRNENWVEEPRQDHWLKPPQEPLNFEVIRAHSLVPRNLSSEERDFR